MNYYDLLEISPEASEEVIKMAYKALVKKYHPDSYKGNPEEAQRILTDINQAYEVLSDKDKRAAYDASLHSESHTSAERDEIDVRRKVAPVSEQNQRSQKKHSFVDFIYSVVNGIKGIIETILGIVVLYLIIGFISGNLSKWNTKIFTAAEDAFFFVSTTFRASHTSQSYEDGTAEYVIDQYIQALFEGDLYTAKQLIDPDNSYLSDSTAAITDTFRMGEATEVELAFLTNDMKNADYTIDEEENGCYYVVFQTYDYQVIYEKALNSLSVFSTTDDAMRSMKKEMSKAKKKLKYGVTFQMSRQDERWIITDIQEKSDFLNALTGNIYKMLKEGQDGSMLLDME